MKISSVDDCRRIMEEEKRKPSRLLPALRYMMELREKEVWNMVVEQGEVERVAALRLSAGRLATLQNAVDKALSHQNLENARDILNDALQDSKA